jgi:hypothetical protein
MNPFVSCLRSIAHPCAHVRIHMHGLSVDDTIVAPCHTACPVCVSCSCFCATGTKTPPLTSFFCVERVTVRTDGTWHQSSEPGSLAASPAARSRRSRTSDGVHGATAAADTAASGSAGEADARRRASSFAHAKQGRLCVTLSPALLHLLRLSAKTGWPQSRHSSHLPFFCFVTRGSRL